MRVVAAPNEGRVNGAKSGVDPPHTDSSAARDDYENGKSLHIGCGLSGSRRSVGFGSIPVWQSIKPCQADLRKQVSTGSAS